MGALHRWKYTSDRSECIDLGNCVDRSASGSVQAFVRMLYLGLVVIV